jgi:hypothetical protein
VTYGAAGNAPARSTDPGLSASASTRTQTIRSESWPPITAVVICPASEWTAAAIAARGATSSHKENKVAKSETKNEKKQDERPVIVTTEHRGVFFGYADNTEGESITLKRSRLCIHWSSDMGGFMGLASFGPSTNCRIGPPADITLRKITSVIEVSAEALKKWEAAPTYGR